MDVTSILAMALPAIGLVAVVALIASLIGAAADGLTARQWFFKTAAIGFVLIAIPGAAALLWGFAKLANYIFDTAGGAIGMAFCLGFLGILFLIGFAVDARRQ